MNDNHLFLALASTFAFVCSPLAMLWLICALISAKRADQNMARALAERKAKRNEKTW